jgi:hypothetical protein
MSTAANSRCRLPQNDGGAIEAALSAQVAKHRQQSNALRLGTSRAPSDPVDFRILGLVVLFGCG